MEEAMDLIIGALTGGCFPLGGYTIGGRGLLALPKALEQAAIQEMKLVWL